MKKDPAAFNIYGIRNGFSVSETGRSSGRRRKEHEMERVEELVRGRRSVRTFDGNRVRPEDLEKLTAFAGRIGNPYGIPVEFQLLDGEKQKLKCPVVSGTDLYIGARVPRVPHGEEALGYSFETLVLYARSLGIGTVWVGGTMDRPAFERAMGLKADERMPCVSPIGYPARRMSIKESAMRKAVRADHREPFEALFFDGSFDKPLTKENAGALAFPLEMVRLAPSAVNRQPWRAAAERNAVHFYVKHAKGFVSDAVGDMQKIDLGIALCHFALAAEENGMELQFGVSDPGINAGGDMEYIASYKIG